MFRIRLTDPDIELIDNPPFAIGAEVEIEMGYLTDLEEVMTGEVAVVQPSFPETGVPSLTVIGYDRSHALRHGCKFQQFQGLNDSGIVQQVAQSNRLSPQVGGTKLPTRDSVSHLGTDWELLEAPGRPERLRGLRPRQNALFPGAGGRDGLGDADLGQGAPQLHPTRDGVGTAPAGADPRL